MTFTSTNRLRALFGMLIASMTVGGSPCGGDCKGESTFVVSRTPPEDPDASSPEDPDASTIDPTIVSNEECTELCGANFLDCEGIVLADGEPAVRCTKFEDCGGAGRRPRGLVRARVAGPSGTAVWLARAAHLEGASVFAFARLAEELGALGAPRSLVARARGAAREEARHARVVGRLAERRGASVRAARVRAAAPRSIVAIALENAVEGCVMETFGALVSQYQARTAEDVGVRRAMRRIAEEETAHAGLALDVDRWLASRLSVSERGRVARAKERAGRKLAGAWGPDPEVARELGLPESGAGRGLIRALDAALGWGNVRA